MYPRPHHRHHHPKPQHHPYPLVAQDLSMATYRKTAQRMRKGDQEVRVTANNSCTLPTVCPRSFATQPVQPHPRAATSRLPPVPPPPPYRPPYMDMAERSKTVTRLLQHSILQLCNEHVGYSHKLQILGVLCMTVDDEQQELVVKVNNTLKRVNPPIVPSKDSAQVLQPAVAPTARLPVYPTNLTIDPQGLFGSSQLENARTASSPNQNLPPGQAHTSPNNLSTGSTPSRKSHGRKGTNPVKVQHVYDEGELISSEEDQDVLTVIPTDPESSYDQMPSPAGVLDTIETSPRPSSSPRRHRPQGSAKRKSAHQYHAINGLTAAGDEGRFEHSQGAASSSISAVRALLLGRGAINTNNSSGPQDLSTGRHTDSALDLGSNASPAPRGLMLPLMMPDTPGEPTDKSMDTTGEQQFINSGAASDNNTPTNLTVNADDIAYPHAGITSPSAFDSELTIKEEPSDDLGYAGYNNNNNNSSGSFDTSADDISQQLASYAQSNGVASTSAITQLLTRTSDGLPTQVPYTLAFTTSTPSKHQDGLTIQYTSTGPITVGKNGKNVSRPSKSAKVKDIILYDDSSPLHEQRGNRIETDYMLDSFGLEGRKRRRRNQDEALTAEEIAEYLGSLDMGNHVFTCKYCTEELHDLTQYLQHTLSMHHCYICHQCGKSFTTKSSLLRHRPIHTGMRRFACSICKKTFYRKDKCKAHIKRHLGEGGDKPEVEHCDQMDAME